MAAPKRPSTAEWLVIAKAAINKPVVVQRYDSINGEVRLEHQKDTLAFVFLELFRCVDANVRCVGYPLGHPDLHTRRSQLDSDTWLRMNSTGWPWPMIPDLELDVNELLLPELEAHPLLRNALWTWVHTGSADITDLLTDLEALTRVPDFTRVASVEQTVEALAEKVASEFEEWLEDRRWEELFATWIAEYEEPPR